MKNIARVLSHICGIGMLAAVGCGMYKAFNEMKAEEKGMPFAEFKQWWEETCKNAPNHIVKSANCHFGYADKMPVVSSSVYFQNENPAMPHGISCRTSLAKYAEAEDEAVLTKSDFDAFKMEFDEQRLPMATPHFVDVFSSVYCSAMQNGKETLSEDDKEKIRKDVLDFQTDMVADLQYISDEFDKLYERLFGTEE